MFFRDYSDPNRKFDGEIMFFGAMSDGDIDKIINHLFAFGYNNPDTGEISDMVIYDMFTGASFVVLSQT